MFDQDGTKLRSIAWREVFPWLALFRSFRIAIDARVLLPAAAGVVLTVAGWSLLGRAFFQTDQPVGWMAEYQATSLGTIDAAVPDRPGLGPLSGRLGFRAFRPTAWHPADPFFGSWVHLSRPLMELFRPEASVASVTCMVLCGLWALAVWSLFGGMIVRMAVVQFAAEERVGIMPTFRFALIKWPSYFLAPLLPVVGIVLCAIGVFLPSLLANFDLGLVLVGLVWPFALVLGFIMALLLLGLLFGWPLMAATISAEGTDSFDALSRSYAYVFQRPLHYLFYALVAAGFGAIGWVLVANFAAGIVTMTHWAASWAVVEGRMAALVGSPNELGEIAGVGTALISFWVGCVKLLAVGFLYGYFFTASGCIYLLLRRDVDATEMDEVYQDADATEPSYGLPPMRYDEAGAPEVGNSGAENSPEAD